MQFISPFFTPDDLVAIGFTFVEDKNEGIQGNTWIYKSPHFVIKVDAWAGVYLYNLSPIKDDPIQVVINSLSDLEFLIQWIS